MIWALLITAATVAVTGLALRYAVPWIFKDSDWSISWREFIAGLIVAYVVVMPAVFSAGKALSTADALRYNEFRNGVETSATVNVVDCHPGTSGEDEESGHSNCDNEHPNGLTYTYLVEVVTTTEDCDDKGDCTEDTTITYVPTTGYEYDPDATKEYTYRITDSLGGVYNFPYSYVKDGEGYKGKSIPADDPRGDPAEWTASKARLDDGNPRPVTRLFDYNNYVLASHDSLLKPFSKNVKLYKKEGILPVHTKNITTNPLHGFNNSTADKVSFVGVKVSNPKAWQSAMMTFDAALGSKLQGDAHLVLIDASLVNNPTDYLNALKAYWLGPDLGRRAIAKNAIIIVVGVQGDTVEWAQASTGMPFGNEVMLQGIENFLPNTPLEPKQVIGDPHTVITLKPNGKQNVQVTLDDKPGVLEREVLQDFPFERACMDCKNDGKQIGYSNLVVDIEPQPWQFGIMIGIVGVLAIVYWLLAGRFVLFAWVRLPGSRRRSNDDDDQDTSSSDWAYRSPVYPISDYHKYKKHRRNLDDVYNEQFLS